MKITEYSEMKKWNLVWNFRARVSRESGDTLRPFTRVMKGTYWNFGGAMFGAPPAEIDCWITPQEFTAAVLKGDIKP